MWERREKKQKNLKEIENKVERMQQSLLDESVKNNHLLVKKGHVTCREYSNGPPFTKS